MHAADLEPLKTIANDVDWVFNLSVNNKPASTVVDFTMHVEGADVPMRLAFDVDHAGYAGLSERGVTVGSDGAGVLHGVALGQLLWFVLRVVMLHARFGGACAELTAALRATRFESEAVVMTGARSESAQGAAEADADVGALLAALGPVLAAPKRAKRVLLALKYCRDNLGAHCYECGRLLPGPPGAPRLCAGVLCRFHQLSAPWRVDLWSELRLNDGLE